MKTRICICGSGNMAHALVGYLGADKDIELSMLSSSNYDWKKIDIYQDNRLYSTGELKLVTNDASEVIPGTDIIIFTVPSFARKKVLNKINPYVKSGALLGSFPGTSGFDLDVKKYISNTSVNIFSAQRVPYIARIRERGISVDASIKENLLNGYNVAILKDKLNVKNTLETLLGMKINVVDNFLEINLSNSNPILHPARLFSLFKYFEEGDTYSRVPLFYKEWDLESSRRLLNMDVEFMKVVNKLNLKNIKSLEEYYGAQGPTKMTDKIRSIAQLGDILTPMIKLGEESYVPDFNSRYFTEDIHCGLNLIKQYADKSDVRTPHIDEILSWNITV